MNRKRVEEIIHFAAKTGQGPTTTIIQNMLNAEHVTWKQFVEHCRDEYIDVQLKGVDPESVTIAWLHDDKSMTWFKIYKADGCVDGYSIFIRPSTLIFLGRYIEGLQ